ncbi:carboxymuconolactone decarboxylase family protein [Photobacterium sp. CCB-ST2H9]|uniref:carboxymuconolactone decarboxylase family protein n=1 Tax=Photobacterium sp. CCB-ST2H9 TaxID=2912855 RepID=UPI0020041493|nr:carboxymuconolactone decarboxylase family protein [Photobacterium sp. CCB-ST2H9]UTM58659.1 carboxymuconolactone decarboxylase family protein [Photobacterium sp. CCB-ST2H9]
MRVPAKKRYSILIRPLLWLQKRHFGQPLNPALLWGRRPVLFYLVASFFGYLDRKRSPLSDVMRSLVCVRVSQLNDCAFCVDANGMRLAQRCQSVEKIQALTQWQESPLFDTQEKAVLAYTEAMTVTGNRVTQQMIDDLKQWYDEDALVELTALVSFQNLSAKFNTALDVPSQAFCSIPLSQQPAPKQNDTKHDQPTHQADKHR